MTIDVEFLLARHPFLFLWRESSVEGFHSGGVLAAIGGGRRDIHPLSAVQRTGDKLADKKRCGEVAVYHKADILLFAADKATAGMGVPPFQRRNAKRLNLVRHFSEITGMSLQGLERIKCHSKSGREQNHNNWRWLLFEENANHNQNSQDNDAPEIHCHRR